MKPQMQHGRRGPRNAVRRSGSLLSAQNCLKRLSPGEAELRQVVFIVGLCRMGIGVHHGGLLPIIKEMVLAPRLFFSCNPRSRAEEAKGPVCLERNVSNSGRNSFSTRTGESALRHRNSLRGTESPRQDGRLHANYKTGIAQLDAPHHCSGVHAGGRKLLRERRKKEEAVQEIEREREEALVRGATLRWPAGRGGGALILMETQLFSPLTKCRLPKSVRRRLRSNAWRGFAAFWRHRDAASSFLRSWR